MERTGISMFSEIFLVAKASSIMNIRRHTVVGPMLASIGPASVHCHNIYWAWSWPFHSASYVKIAHVNHIFQVKKVTQNYDSRLKVSYDYLDRENHIQIAISSTEVWRTRVSLLHSCYLRCSLVLVITARFQLRILEVVDNQTIQDGGV